MKILLIDDEKSLVEVLFRGLTKLGHQVSTAGNGQEGYSIFCDNDENFDLILMDIKMPILTGLELLERIRDEDYDVPVIIMTGHGDLNSSIQAIRLGAFDFILKPFKFSSLSAILTRLEVLRIPEQEFKNFFPDYEETIHLSIPSRVKLSHNVTVRIQSIFNTIFQYYKINGTQVGLCLMEALSNAITHGNLEISSELKEEDWDSYSQLMRDRENDPKYGGKKVQVQCKLANGKLVIEVEDEGMGFDTSILPDPRDPENIMMGSGRGLFMIRVYMDEVRWNESGNRIVMTKKLAS